MVKAKQAPKPRANKYEEKQSVNGTFVDVFKVIKKNKEQKKEQPKK